MTKKRHSTQDIAEILIDKFNDLERTAKTIEQASNKTIKIDTTELKQILEEHRKEQRRILSDLGQLRGRNQTRLPNWVFGVLAGLILTMIGFSVYTWKKAEAYDYQKASSEHFEQEYLKLKNEEKGN